MSKPTAEEVRGEVEKTLFAGLENQEGTWFSEQDRTVTFGDNGTVWISYPMEDDELAALPEDDDGDGTHTFGFRIVLEPIEG